MEPPPLSAALSQTHTFQLVLISCFQALCSEHQDSRGRGRSLTEATLPSSAEFLRSQDALGPGELPLVSYSGN